MGNTCFISSVLHCLINCEPLENIFLFNLIHPYQSCRALRSEEGCLACELDRAFLEYFGSANSINALGASSLPCTHFWNDKQRREFCGHPLILSSFLAETWTLEACCSMKELAGQNQNNAQEFLAHLQMLWLAVTWFKDIMLCLNWKRDYAQVKSNNLQ